jgi:hypothetical protein
MTEFLKLHGHLLRSTRHYTNTKRGQIKIRPYMSARIPLMCQDHEGHDVYLIGI